MSHKFTQRLSRPVTEKEAARWPFYICLFCFAVLFVRFPGEWDADTVSQHAQMLARNYQDWHPPVFAAFWGLLNRAWNSLGLFEVKGSGLLFIAQGAAFWGGLALLLRASRKFWLGFCGKALWKLLLPLAGLLLFGLAELVPMTRFIFKDTSMLAAYSLALGLMFNLPPAAGAGAGAGQTLPRLKRWAMFFLCLLALFYGTAVRHNSIFSLLPILALLLINFFEWRAIWKIVLGSLFCWAAILTAIHLVNYTVLGAQKEYSIQETYYGDIWRMNYKTKKFALPPPVNGEGWDAITPEIFYTFYNNTPYIHEAFKHIQKALPQPVPLYRDFSQSPQELETLRKAWLDRIKEKPVDYISVRRKIFSALMKSYSMFGLSSYIYLIICAVGSIALVPALLRLRSGRDPKSLSPHLFALSGLLYVLPYLLVLPAIQRRYLFWFFLAGLLASLQFIWQFFQKYQVDYSVKKR